MRTMKKMLSVLLACVLLLAALPAFTALAAGELIEGTHVRWSYNSDTKTLTFTGYGPMPDQDLNVPPVLPWHDAVEEIETVVFSNGITSIGDGCFPFLPALRRVVFPESLVRIGVANFYCCKNLTEAALPEGLLFLGDHSFWLTGITRAEIPVGVKTLEYAFDVSPALTEVVLHEGLERIENCFTYAALESLELPASLISVTGCDFVGLKRLVNRSLTAVAHEQMDSIADAADRDLMLFALRLECELTETYYSMLLRGQTEEAELVMEQLLGEALEKARLWLNDTYGVALETPEDVLDYFETHVYVTGAPVPGAEIYCVSGSAEDKALDKTSIPHYLLDRDNALCDRPPEWSGTAGEHITWAVDAATGTLTFTGYGDANDVLYAGYHRLSDIITSVQFECTEGPITFIGDSAFEGFANLTELTLPQGLTWLGENIIKNSGVRVLTLPGTLQVNDYNGLFRSLRLGSAPLQRIELSGESERLFTDHGALYMRYEEGGCCLLKLPAEAADYPLHEGVTRFESYAIEGLPALTEFTVPGTVDYVYYQPFYDLPALETLYLEPNEMTVENSRWLFGGSTSIAAFVVDENDPRYFVRDGVLYDKTDMFVCGVPGRTDTLELAEDIKGIDSDAVQEGKTLSRITIPSVDFDFDYGYPGFYRAPYLADDTVLVCSRGSRAEAYALRHGCRVEYPDGVTLTGVSIEAYAPLEIPQYDSVELSDLPLRALLSYSDGSTGYLDAEALMYSWRDFGNDDLWIDTWTYSNVLGEFPLGVRLGDVIETFTVRVVPNLVSYRFDVSGAITDFAVYELIYRYTLGVKLLRIDPVTGEETEVKIDSDCSFTEWNGTQWVESDHHRFTEAGTYRLKLEYRGYAQELEVNVTENDVQFTTNAGEAVTEVPRFTHYNKEYGGNRLFVTQGGVTKEITEQMEVGRAGTGGGYTYPVYAGYDFLFPDTTVPGDTTFFLYANYGFNDYTANRSRSFWVELPLPVTVVAGDVTDAYLDLSGVPETLPTQSRFTPGELGIRLVKIMADGSVQIDENPDGYFHWIYMPGLYSGKTLDTPYGSTTLYVKFHCGGLTAQFNVKVHSHSLIFVPAAASADCRMQGNIDHWHCTSCGRNFADEAAETALDNVTDGIYGPHAPLGEYAGFAPTCTEDGLVPYYVCALCCQLTDANGNLIADPLLPAGHNYEWVDEVAPTCTEPGIVGHYTCTLCDRDFDENKAPLADLSIAATGHTPGTAVRENVIAATCTVNGGYDEVVYCVNCPAEVSRTHVKTPAAGHNWGEWEVIKQATVSEEGLMRRVCKNDTDHVEEEIIPKLQPQTSAFQRFIERIRDFFKNIIDWFRKLFRF